jgi:hypothetical protein
MSFARPASVLLLCDFDPFGAQMIQDSIHAIARRSNHGVRCLSFRGDLPADLDLARFDAIVVHYSSLIHNDWYVSPLTRRRIGACDAFKAVLLHDEYQNVNRTKAALAELGAMALFTCFEESEAQHVYADLVAGGMRLHSVLPGYVAPELRDLDPGTPASTRPIDIGYRGRRYPSWHGELGQERVRIHERVKADAPAFGLTVDSSVSEHDRLYGADWFRFQRRCKAVLGTESGASVIDFTGEIAQQVDAHVAATPDTPFEELRRLYFAETENAVILRTVSPRIFEAIACGCALILYEGAYAGRLTPGRHYAPLRKDHGNFAEIVALLRNGPELDRMAAAAREEVLLAPENQEAAFIDQFDSVIAQATAQSAARGYDAAQFASHFGRYDGLLNRHVVKRQLFRTVHRAYAAATSVLPATVERRLTAAVRETWHDFRSGKRVQPDE